MLNCWPDGRRGGLVQGGVEVPPLLGQLPRVTLTEQAGVAFPGPRIALGAAADPRGPAEAPRPHGRRRTGTP